MFSLGFISRASMNPTRSLAPALLSGELANLWLYWTATFIGTVIIAFLFRKKFNYTNSTTYTFKHMIVVVSMMPSESFIKLLEVCLYLIFRR